ncbi:Kin of IRRE-like protein 1 [Varanus komodoensis]|nr:Kin of IRRE-like protein 1 [Varanus komodoensis]
MRAGASSRLWGSQAYCLQYEEWRLSAPSLTSTRRERCLRFLGSHSQATLYQQVLSNGNTLHLKAVAQEDAGVYVCKAIVPRIGVAEKEVTLAVNGPPIISTEPSQQTAVGTKARLECLVGSIPPPDRIAWAWGERVLDAGSLDRFSVDTMVTDQGVLSALLIDPTHDADFALPYNCTAWNRFGARSAAVSLRRQEVWSVLILGALAASGVGALLILVVFVSLCYRRKRCRKGEDPVAPCSTSSPLCFATSSLLKPNRA